jgi:hypothetical protein
LALLDIPQICAAHIADVDWSYLAEEDRGKERRYEGDARSRLVGFGMFFLEALDLRATEALSHVLA